MICVTFTGITGYRTCFRASLCYPRTLSCSGRCSCFVGRDVVDFSKGRCAFLSLQGVTVQKRCQCKDCPVVNIKAFYSLETRQSNHQTTEYNIMEDLNSNQRCSDGPPPVQKLTEFYFTCCWRLVCELRVNGAELYGAWVMNRQGLRRKPKWFNRSIISELTTSDWEKQESLIQDVWCSYFYYKSYYKPFIISLDSQRCTSFLCECFCGKVIEIHLGFQH